MSLSRGSRRIALAARVALTAGLTTALLAPAGTASAAPSAAATANQVAALRLFPSFAALPDSLGLRAPLMLAGRLTEPEGPALSGATVLLSAWPSNETVDRLPDGSRWVRPPIARTTASRDGSYQLRSSVTTLVASLLGKDGLDLQLDVFHGGRRHTRLTQIRLAEGLGWVLPSVTDARGGAGNTLDLTFDKPDGIATAPDLKLAAAANRPTHHGDDDDPTTDPGPHPFPGAWCVDRKIGERRTMTTVATSLAHNGVTAQVAYLRGAQSRLSAGLSTNGGVSFTVAGDKTRTSQFTGSFRPKPGTKQGPAHIDYLINMKHAVIAEECVGDNMRDIRVRQVKTSPMGPSGGGRPVPSWVPIWKCAVVEPAEFDFVNTEDAQAFTYTKGFNFAPYGPGSFTGEATSGYSDTVKVTYSFKHPDRGRWCGHTRGPLDKGQLVQGFELPK